VPFAHSLKSTFPQPNTLNTPQTPKLMKLNTRNVKAKAGMTLLELTVVILVLLSLISILFIGARAWKKGSDRAGCIMNIRNIQQAVRGHQNMTNLSIGSPLNSNVIIGANGYLGNNPTCPTDGATYTFPSATVPAMATLYAKCTNYGGTGKTILDANGNSIPDPNDLVTLQHFPTNVTADW
jgi:type II secretory pathway pseudopilin PulG